MAIWKSVEMGKFYMGKARFGSDLLEEITDLCRTEGVRTGWVKGLGAVQKAKIGYYGQSDRQYKIITLDRGMEITHLVGNITLKEGDPMVHAHVSLADSDGLTYGGHLVSGTIVFACEFIVQTFEGPIFERGFDQETGLPLWKMAEEY